MWRMKFQEGRPASMVLQWVFMKDTSLLVLLAAFVVQFFCWKKQTRSTTTTQDKLGLLERDANMQMLATQTEKRLEKLPQEQMD